MMTSVYLFCLTNSSLLLTMTNYLSLPNTVCPIWCSSHFILQRNEYIFTIVEPGHVKKSEEDNKGDILKRKERDITAQEKDGKKKESRNKSNEEHGGIILGLRFSRKCLHFLFKGQGGAVEHWVFRGTRLADNLWHTLVLTVNGQHVKLTVDCSSPLQM